jgi:hypothetical protein
MFCITACSNTTSEYKQHVYQDDAEFSPAAELSQNDIEVKLSVLVKLINRKFMRVRVVAAAGATARLLWHSGDCLQILTSH